MRRLKSILGPLGFVLILVGGVAYGILYTSGAYAILPLLAGLIISAISLTLSYREKRTEGFRRSARYGFHTGVSILFLAAILIFVQTIIGRHGAAIDTTANRRHSLAPQSIDILDDLTNEVTLTCFFKSTAPEKLLAEDLLTEYARLNPLVRYRFIDPDTDPATARRYGIERYGTVVVSGAEREETISEVTESQITNAILRVSRGTRTVIYVVTGHGEKGLDDTGDKGLSELKAAIEAENYIVRPLFTMRVERIPADCGILIFAGPAGDIAPAERASIGTYLAAGGDALLLLDPLAELPLLGGIAEEYGITVNDDMIVDRFAKLVAGNYLTPIINIYGDHPITANFRHATSFMQTRSLTVVEDAPDGVTALALATTVPQAYAETNIEKLLEGQSQFEGESDTAGPLHIAAVATRTGPGGGSGTVSGGGAMSRVVVFGDSDFAANKGINLMGNRDLILNTIQWLAAQEDLITIRPRDPLTQPVVISERQGRIVFWLPVIGMPALSLALGLAISVRKRRSA